MFLRLSVLLTVLLCLPLSLAAKLEIKWDELPAVPDELGLGGLQAGVHNDALIVAGGANFPNGFPWEGGAKVWHDKIHVLPDYADAGSNWVDGGVLPMPLAHGTSHSIEDGFIIIGGGNSETHSANVLKLQWDGSAVTISELPPLPEPLAFHASVMIGKKIYVTGGTRTPSSTSAQADLYRLDLEMKPLAWETLEPMPGEGRIMPVIATIGGHLFVAGGASLHPDEQGKPARTYLVSAYRYNPSGEKGSRWDAVADMPRRSVAAPTPSPSIGPSHFVVLGGDDGTNLPPAVALKDHPGFNSDILAYHAITNTWAVLGKIPFATVTGPVIQANSKFIIPSGEIRPGVRTARVQIGEVQVQKVDFGIINYVVLFAYLIGVTVLGLAFTGSNKDTDEYFRGAGRIPWWAAGLSIFATMSSSIGYFAITAKSYSEDWIYMLTSLPIVLLAPVIIRYYLPFFRHVNSSSAYEFLEHRFSVLARLFASSAFLLFHMGRMAVVLYLPALAIATVTPLPESWSILVMGFLCVIYCSAGGVRAVIFTDSLQSIVLLGALLFSLVFAIFAIDGGIGTFFTVASADHKFKLIETSWSPLVPALWVVIIGHTFANLFPYTADQAVVQRYMTTKDEKAAARSIWTNAILSIPNTLLMFLLGTAIYVFYKNFPERLSPTIYTDAIFPLFIANELPIGLAGLAIAGVLAAAQSTVSTSINSISTVLMVDVVGRFKLAAKGAEDLALARWISILSGVIGTGLALMISRFGTGSLWDLYIIIMGLTGSSLAGLFILGIFTTRSTGLGAVIGAIVSVPCLYLVREHSSIHIFLYAPVGVGVTVLVGYAVSLLTSPKPIEELKDLTLHTIEK
jgi:SSS family solute:Na+ symporter